MLKINDHTTIKPEEVELIAIRAQGAGGQNVNKVSSAIHLRFDIANSSLHDVYKQRLLALKDHRITKEGVIVIKAQQYRTQEQNREDALNRLIEIIKTVTVQQKSRRPTKPTKGSQTRRLNSKTKKGQIKALRGRITD
ncbi:alternative ribosome rescue aminoacyl-tRNA hydrolase ArfB [Neptunomonas concharum]|uniref:Peptidyl-tRNA hydrolase ArfB n=1 Tax=Neptunomonas concharum TaxID=1031538 RepID=A0A5P1RA28_9GAMM|nr:alternative ribosome rescue aminoacyl-tRNA hydrolase ArfB [Neptunomonas concharum]QEQ96480.1 aminoacyl-tRNA hydrolase [Neptunomonas concharum]